MDVSARIQGWRRVSNGYVLHQWVQMRPDSSRIRSRCGGHESVPLFLKSPEVARWYRRECKWCRQAIARKSDQ
jgi:uncharacterized protein YaeQ